MGANVGLVARWRESLEERLVESSKGFSKVKLQTVLHTACRYVSEGGGKRLRGLLVCGVSFDLLGLVYDVGDTGPGISGALSAAVAIELLHAASLVHDDLPALDNDDLRRGRASCHRAFGEATAILTGDALIGAALMVVTSSPDLSSDNQARLTRVLSRAWWDLCVGQQLDVDQKLARSNDLRLEMVRLKTGALFGAAIGCGAVCAGVHDRLLESYIAWGIRIGECFQALDDLDDGDRNIADRELILAECEQVIYSIHELDPRLVGGVTHDVLREVFNLGSLAS